MVTESRLQCTRIAEERAYEIAECIGARLTKATADGTMHQGFDMWFKVRTDHAAYTTELLGQTFPFIVIEPHEGSLNIMIPAS